MSDYKIFIDNPSDNEKNISGTIKIETLGPKKRAIGEMIGFPDNGKIGPLEGQFSFTPEVSLLIDEMLAILVNQIISVYSVNLTGRLVTKLPDTPLETKETAQTSSDLNAIHNSIDENKEDIKPIEKINGIFEFNVEKDKIFIIKSQDLLDKIGELVISESEGFIFTEDDDITLLSDEFTESPFLGIEESYEDFVGEELNSNSSSNVNQDESKVNFDSSGISTHMKPTSSGFIQGDSYTKTIEGGGKWTKSVDSTYRLSGFKYGKSKITTEGWIKWKKEAEGGKSNATTDGAYKTYGDKTVVPISKKDIKNSKDYDNLCYGSSGKRLYNIHTNKGIIYMVWEKQFGKSIEAQKRFLNMNDADWWSIMKTRFYDPNKGDQINSIICRLMWISWCWGSGTGGAIKNLNNCLNLLSNSNNFNSTSGITSAHINYMNSLDENLLISAMYDVRFQFFLNISQPNNSNSIYRNGWINGLNKWIELFHDKQLLA